MFENEETISQSIEKKIKEFERDQEAHDREMNDFFSNLGISMDELKAHFSNPSNFSEEEWAMIKDLRLKAQKDFEEKVAKSAPKNAISRESNVPPPGAFFD